jgi:hypothetical protein
MNWPANWKPPGSQLEYIARSCLQRDTELKLRVERLEKWTMRLAAAVALLFVVTYRANPEAVEAIAKIVRP